MTSSFGPSHCFMISGVVQHLKRSAGEALMKRCVMMIGSVAGAITSSFEVVMGILLALQCLQVVFEALVARLKILLVAANPIRKLLDPLRLQLPGAPLGVPSLGNQPGALEYLQMFGNRRLAQLEWLCQLRYRGIAPGQPLHDRAAGRVRKSGK